MNEPIKVGDLVLVVRWPHSCINESRVPGTPFVVTNIEPLTGVCKNCRQQYGNYGSLGARGDSGHGRVPLAWLKRIPPLSELDDVKQDEEITA